MSWSSTITERPAAYINGKLMSWGTWAADAVTSGNIDTGLAICDFIALTPYGSAAGTLAISVNETMPCTGSAVTIDIGTSVDVDGYWWAFGR